MTTPGRKEWRSREKGPDRQKYATIGELAQMCGVTKRTMRRWVASGRVPAAEARSEAGWQLWSPDQITEVLQSL